MKPAWDQLTEEFPGVYDVDCTAGGKDLCDKVGVQGYPSIKYGDPDDLQDYNGGRDFDELKKFAEKHLGPVCGPKTLDACKDDERAKLEKYLAMPYADLQAEIKKLDKDLNDRSKKYGKRRRKFDEKDKEFQEEWKDYQSDKRKLDSAKSKLEENAKATKAEKSKHDEKEKKLQARGSKLETRKEATDKERESFDSEKATLDSDLVESGIKLMKLAISGRKKDEL